MTKETLATIIKNGFLFKFMDHYTSRKYTEVLCNNRNHSYVIIQRFFIRWTWNICQSIYEWGLINII